MCNESRDLQHPDITQAERSGYPFPRKQTVTVTEDLAKDFCLKMYDTLWCHLMVCFSDAVPDFLDNYAEEFNDYLTDI